MWILEEVGTVLAGYAMSLKLLSFVPVGSGAVHYLVSLVFFFIGIGTATEL